MNMLGEKLPVELIKPQLKSQVREMGHKIYHQCIQIIADSFCKPLTGRRSTSIGEWLILIA